MPLAVEIKCWRFSIWLVDVRKVLDRCSIEVRSVIGVGQSGGAEAARRLHGGCKEAAMRLQGGCKEAARNGESANPARAWVLPTVHSRRGRCLRRLCICGALAFGGSIRRSRGCKEVARRPQGGPQGAHPSSGPYEERAHACIDRATGYQRL